MVETIRRSFEAFPSLWRAPRGVSPSPRQSCSPSLWCLVGSANPFSAFHISIQKGCCWCCFLKNGDVIDLPHYVSLRYSMWIWYIEVTVGLPPERELMPLMCHIIIILFVKTGSSFLAALKFIIQ